MPLRQRHLAMQRLGGALPTQEHKRRKPGFPSWL